MGVGSSMACKNCVAEEDERPIVKLPVPTMSLQEEAEDKERRFWKSKDKLFNLLQDRESSSEIQILMDPPPTLHKLAGCAVMLVDKTFLEPKWIACKKFLTMDALKLVDNDFRILIPEPILNRVTEIMETNAATDKQAKTAGYLGKPLRKFIMDWMDFQRIQMQDFEDENTGKTTTLAKKKNKLMAIQTTEYFEQPMHMQEYEDIHKIEFCALDRYQQKKYRLLHKLLTGQLANDKSSSLIANQICSYLSLMPLVEVYTNTNPPVDPRVTCCMLSNRNDFIISGQHDHTFAQWNTETGDLCRLFKGHTDTPLCCELSLDDKSFVSGGKDNSVRVWNIKKGKCICTLTGHTNHVTCLAMVDTEKFCVSGSKDNTVRVWELVSQDTLYTFSTHTGPVTCVYWDSVTQYIVSGSEDTTLKVWDIGAEQRRKYDEGLVLNFCKETLQGHNDKVSACVVTSDRRLISGSYDHTIRIWALYDDFECLHVLEHRQLGGKCGIEALVLSSNQNYLITGSFMRGDSLKLWNIETHTFIRSLFGGKSVKKITALCLGGLDDRFVVIGTAKNGLHVITHVEDGKEFSVFESPEDFYIKNRLAVGAINSFVQQRTMFDNRNNDESESSSDSLKPLRSISLSALTF